MFFKHLLERFSSVATVGPLALPIWIAFLFLVLSFLRGPLLRIIFKVFGANDQSFDQAVRKRIDAPLQLLFITLALMPFTELIVHPLAKTVQTLVHMMAFVCLFYIIIQSVDLALFSWYFARKQTKISSVVRVFVLSILYAIAAMLLLDWGIGVSVLPLLATSTVLTAVLGLALQDTLKNGFAGLNMSLENSFEQGDWVMFRLDATEQWFGQIVEIGWRTTKIKTLNNNYAIIPNSAFTAHELINFNKPSATHGRTVEIPVSLKADAAKVKSALIKAMTSVGGVLNEPAPTAQPTAITDSHVTYQVRFWLDHLDKREEMTGAVLESCWQELKDMGALPKP